MTRMCECLAAWVDSEPCICGEPIGSPMEASAKKLSQANQLVSEVREIDRALEYLGKNKPYCSTTLRYTGNNHVNLHLPPDVAAGLLRTMRFQTLVKLAETGVTSMATGYRPVVSA